MNQSLGHVVGQTGIVGYFATYLGAELLHRASIVVFRGKKKTFPDRLPCIDTSYLPKGQAQYKALLSILLYTTR